MQLNKVIVLGSSGFVGQNLLCFLEGKENVKGLSLRNSEWKKEMQEATYVVNLVGKAHDHKGEATEKDFYDVNYELTKEIFEQFMDSDAKLLIHISSIAAIEEYNSDKSLIEDMECNPESWYGKSKREAENWLQNQSISDNKKIVILRPPMIHGPGDKGNLGLLYKLISMGIPYPLSSFNNVRSFISIDNFCFMIYKIIQNNERIESGVYHIADDQPISTNQIIEIIKKIENKKTPNIRLPKELVKVLAKFGDVIPIPLNSKRLKKMTGSLIVSNQKIKSQLGIRELPLSATQGIEKTIESFKKLKTKN